MNRSTGSPADLFEGQRTEIELKIDAFLNATSNRFVHEDKLDIYGDYESTGLSLGSRKLQCSVCLD